MRLRGWLPSWQHLPCTARVTLLLDGHRLNMTWHGAPTPTHVFQPSFAAFLSLQGATPGGSELVIRGHALPANGSYQCRFVGVSGIVAYPDCDCNTGCSAYKCVAAQWISPTTVVCKAPKWPRQGVASVALLLDGKTISAAREGCNNMGLSGQWLELVSQGDGCVSTDDYKALEQLGMGDDDDRFSFLDLDGDGCVPASLAEEVLLIEEDDFFMASGGDGCLSREEYKAAMGAGGSEGAGSGEGSGMVGSEGARSGEGSGSGSGAGEDDGVCTDEIGCGAGLFCNFDDGAIGFCEPCAGCPDCDACGLPVEGAIDCNAKCWMIALARSMEDVPAGAFGGGCCPFSSYHMRTFLPPTRECARACVT